MQVRTHTYIIDKRDEGVQSMSNIPDILGHFSAFLGISVITQQIQMSYSLLHDLKIGNCATPTRFYSSIMP